MKPWATLGKSIVQARGNTTIINIISKHQLYENKRVLEHNRKATVPQKITPGVMCTASVKARKMNPVSMPYTAKTGGETIGSKLEATPCALAM